MTDTLLSVAEAARGLSVSEATVKRYVAEGALEIVSRARRNAYLSASAVMEFVKARKPSVIRTLGGVITHVRRMREAPSSTGRTNEK